MIIKTDAQLRRTTVETRHYIGVTPLGRLHMTIGPAAPEDFKTPPTEPITTRAGDVLYPVSAEVAAEWDLDEALTAALTSCM